MTSIVCAKSLGKGRKKCNILPYEVLFMGSLLCFLD